MPNKHPCSSKDIFQPRSAAAFADIPANIQHSETDPRDTPVRRLNVAPMSCMQERKWRWQQGGKARKSDEQRPMPAASTAAAGHEAHFFSIRKISRPTFGAILLSCLAAGATNYSFPTLLLQTKVTKVHFDKVILFDSLIPCFLVFIYSFPNTKPHCTTK